MDPTTKFADTASELANSAAKLAKDAAELANQATQVVLPKGTEAATEAAAAAGHGDQFLFLFTVFVLACFIGFYVIWSVTPALHSPLMGVTNAISSVIIVGAILAAGPEGVGFSQIMGFVAVTLASVNIFGGFMVTHRMLAMFKKKEPKKQEA